MRARRSPAPTPRCLFQVCDLALPLEPPLCSAPQRYLAALMNCENDSHQTTAVLYCDTSTDGGTATMKFSKVFTSPRRTERPLSLKKASRVSANSGDR